MSPLSIKCDDAEYSYLLFWRTPLAIMLVAIVLLTVQAIVINRLAGIDYPLWAKRVPVRPE